MSYRILVADTSEDLFGDSPYGSLLVFYDFECGASALEFARLMMNHGKAVAIIPDGERDGE